MTVGERIKTRRQQLGLSAEDVAKIMGVSPSTIYRYESKNIVNMGIDKLQPIANALQTTASYLMGLTDSPLPIKGNNDSYYLEPEVAQLAQSIYDRPEMKVLFDATKDVSKEDLDFIINMLERMKK